MGKSVGPSVVKLPVTWMGSNVIRSTFSHDEHSDMQCLFWQTFLEYVLGTLF